MQRAHGLIAAIAAAAVKALPGVLPQARRRVRAPLRWLPRTISARADGCASEELGLVSCPALPRHLIEQRDCGICGVLVMDVTRVEVLGAVGLGVLVEIDRGCRAVRC
jgi:hypothetical protein